MPLAWSCPPRITKKSCICTVYRVCFPVLLSRSWLGWFLVTGVCSTTCTNAGNANFTQATQHRMWRLGLEAANTARHGKNTTKTWLTVLRRLVINVSAGFDVKQQVLAKHGKTRYQHGKNTADSFAMPGQHRFCSFGWKETFFRKTRQRKGKTRQKHDW